MQPYCYLETTYLKQGCQSFLKTAFWNLGGKEIFCWQINFPSIQMKLLQSSPKKNIPGKNRVRRNNKINSKIQQNEQVELVF